MNLYSELSVFLEKDGMRYDMHAEKWDDMHVFIRNTFPLEKSVKSSDELFHVFGESTGISLSLCLLVCPCICLCIKYW